MSHELEENDTMFSVRETPWHGLGTVVQDAPTLDEALILAGLDWEVERVPLYAQVQTGETEHSRMTELVEVPNRYGIARTDSGDILGTVGGGYEEFQNREGFELLGILMDQDEVRFETAGSLRNNRTVWGLARIGDDVTIGGDQLQPFLLFTSSHDGSSAVRVAATMVRVVCANTLRWSLQNAASQFTAVHRRGISNRVAEAREALALGWKYVEEFQAEAEALQAQVVTDDQFQAIVEGIWPEPEEATKRQLTSMAERRGQVRSIYEEAPEIGDWQGTGWGVAQAFSGWDLWQRPVRGAKADNARLERQANRLLGGEHSAFMGLVRSQLHAVTA